MRNRGEKGVTLLIGILSLTLIIPMMGLGIDVGFLYAVKSKLQAAVDGAALAAARSLNIGQDTASQAASAQNTAVTWFYDNFPSSYFGTANTVMSTSNVSVFDDPHNSHMREVTVTATSQVDTFFMKWLSFGATTIGATATATRRDVVMMMIMDRSDSMNNNNGCSNMRAAAKLFTGQFAAGRDSIGMVEFGDTAWVDSPPTTNFRSTLGYSVDGSSGSGLIDSITCGDNTGTAQAISLGYNELYKLQMAGAFNILLLFTDGIPNSVTLNLQNVMLPASTCRDSSGKALNAGGSFVNFPPQWTPGWALGSGSYHPDIPAGPIGVIAADDPNGSGTGGVREYAGVSQSNTNHGTIPGTAAPGCAFTGGENLYVNDFQLLPPADIWGNATVNNTYNPLTTDSNGNIVLSAVADPGTPLTGNNLIFHLAARNAADSAASAARSNTTLPATIFGIGLGGTSNSPPGYDFMQRLCNDPNGDLFNVPARYGLCSTEPSCAIHSDQPEGVFAFSSDPSQLQVVFLRLASEILRLSR